MMRRLMMGSIDASFRPESVALFLRMSVQPTVLRKVAINSLISSLVLNDVWDDLDALYVAAAHTSQAAALNWKGATYNLTNNGAGFTTDRGFDGDGVSAYLNTGYQPGAGQFAAAGHAFGVWVRVAGSGTSVPMGAMSYPAFGYASKFQNTTASDGEGPTSALSTQLNHMAVSRTSSTTYLGYVNGALETTQGSASYTINTSNEFFILALNNQGSPSLWSDGQVGGAHMGASLTGPKVAALYAALATYMTAVGA